MIWIGSQPSTIVFITIDALRYDALSWMPTLQTLADNNTTVQNCYSVGSNTPTAMPGLMQSRLPTDYGLTPVPQPLHSELTTLAESLASNGYRSIGLHSNPYLTSEFNFDRGFDIFSDLFHTGNSIKGILATLSERLHLKPQARRVYELFQRKNESESVSTPYAKAESLTDVACNYLSDSDTSRTFCWLHYMDTHHPYAPPMTYRERIETCPTDETHIFELLNRADGGGLDLQAGAYSGSEKDEIQALYRAEAEYIDDQISRLIKTIRDAYNWSETLVVVTADHGELLGDRRSPSDTAFGHPGYLCEELTHVPLIFAGGQVPEQQITNVASLIDIAPTIADGAETSIPETWNGTVLGSDSFAQRDSVRGAVMSVNASDGFGENTLHAFSRTKNYATLWWATDNKTAEYYRRTLNGEVRVDVENKPEQLSKQTSLMSKSFSGSAEQLKRLSEKTLYEGYDTEQSIDIDRKRRNRLNNLGYL
jgi:arylsulfatase A-like enzyme